MEDVEAFLCENSTIHELYLGHNFITDTGLAKIGLGLQENEALEILDLSNNRIKGESSQFSFLFIHSSKCSCHHVKYNSIQQELLCVCNLHRMR